MPPSPGVLDRFRLVADCTADMAPVHRAVLMELAQHADADGWCWPSTTRLSDRTRFGRRAVGLALADLADAGLVTIEDWADAPAAVCRRSRTGGVAARGPATLRRVRFERLGAGSAEPDLITLAAARRAAAKLAGVARQRRRGAPAGTKLRAGCAESGRETAHERARNCAPGAAETAHQVRTNRQTEEPDREQNREHRAPIARDPAGGEAKAGLPGGWGARGCVAEPSDAARAAQRPPDASERARAALWSAGVREPNLGRLTALVGSGRLTLEKVLEQIASVKSGTGVRRPAAVIVAGLRDRAGVARLGSGVSAEAHAVAARIEVLRARRAGASS